MTAMAGWPGQLTGGTRPAGTDTRPPVWGVLVSSASEVTGGLVKRAQSRDEARELAVKIARNQAGILTALCWAPASDPNRWTVLGSARTPREHLQRLELTGQW